MAEPKKITPRQALMKLTALCSQAEHCTADMEEKLRKWAIDEHDQAEIMAYLLRERYVDDARFARFFINDKLRFNKWGRRKIEQALQQKHIPSSVSAPLFAEIEDETYMEVLLPMLRSKWKTIKGRNEYERSMKLIRYAMGRGYDITVIRKCVDLIAGADTEADVWDED
ncbi:regulatory protein RecX [Prevotella sp.]|uniref:regulatory protein RecX n=1 Tax=Prevotella sp. TaxID=59823 RepID=UPI002F95120E